MRSTSSGGQEVKMNTRNFGRNAISNGIKCYSMGEMRDMYKGFKQINNYKHEFSKDERNLVKKYFKNAKGEWNVEKIKSHAKNAKGQDGEFSSTQLNDFRWPTLNYLF